MDYPIIDAHIHPFIDGENNICSYKNFDTAGMLAELKSCGVVKCAGSVIKVFKHPAFEDVKKLNNDAWQLYQKHPDFYIPGISFHHGFIEESMAEIEKYANFNKPLIIGEILNYVTGATRFSAPELDPIWDLCSKLNLLCSIHRISLEDIECLAKKFPKLKIMLAHPGEKTEYLASLEVMKNCPNLMLDLSGTGLFRYGMLKYGVSEVGAERLVFGSDFPVCNCLMNIYGVLGEKLPEAVNRMIFSRNFLRLLER